MRGAGTIAKALLIAGVVLMLALHSQPGKALAHRAVAQFHAQIASRYLQGSRVGREACGLRTTAPTEVSS